MFLDRILTEQASGSGTGNITWTQASTQFALPPSGINQQVTYTLLDSGGTAWETGKATLTESGGTYTLTRGGSQTVEASSSSGSAISLTNSAAHTLFLTPSASDLDLITTALQRTGDTIVSYYETGGQLIQSTSSLTIPINGKVHYVTPTDVITSISVTKPTAPTCASCVIYFIQGSTGYSVTLPNTWYWSDGIAETIDSAANSITRLLLTIDPVGNVHADLEYRDTP